MCIGSVNEAGMGGRDRGCCRAHGGRSGAGPRRGRTRVRGRLAAVPDSGRHRAHGRGPRRHAPDEPELERPSIPPPPRRATAGRRSTRSSPRPRARGSTSSRSSTPSRTGSPPSRAAPAKTARGPRPTRPRGSTRGARSWRMRCAVTAPAGSSGPRTRRCRSGPLRVWQIWNEQNDPGFFKPQPDAGRYGDLFGAAAEAIHGQDPGAEVILGGCAATRFTVATAASADGVPAAALRRPGGRDGDRRVAIHPYGQRMRGVEHQVETTAAVVRQLAPDPQTPLWITRRPAGLGPWPPPARPRAPRPGAPPTAGVRLLQARG